MVHHLTTAGAVHAGLAFGGVVVGLIQLLQVKGTPVHRALGHAYVYGMLVADGAAPLITRFTGTFNILHVGAIANLVCIVAAMVPVLRSPRRGDWRIQHYYWISWSYVGLLAAGATQLVVRMGDLATMEQAWMAAAVTSVAVTTVGYVLIRRYRPVPGSQSALSDLKESA